LDHALRAFGRDGAAVLDLACGGGRHTRLFLARGHPVTAADLDLGGLADLRGHPQLELIAADLEGAPWPLPGRRFGAVVVTNYLWRPLFPAILESVDEGGVLLYDTFARGNEVRRPTNPDFLLGPAADRGGPWPVADAAHQHGYPSGRGRRSGSGVRGRADDRCPCPVRDAGSGGRHLAEPPTAGSPVRNVASPIGR
jgi:SAM-dependent methyltransferase